MKYGDEAFDLTGRSVTVSRLISRLTPAPLFNLYTGLVVSLTSPIGLGPTLDALTVLTLCVFLMVIAPVVPIVYDAWQGRVDLDVSDRSKRGWYFLWALMCYATAYAAYYVGECHVMAVLSAAYFTVTLGVMLATLRYKVSVHAAGAAGPSTALVYMYGWTAAPVVLVWGAIVWSRVKLRQHTARQGMVGLFLGAAITALTYLWLFQ